MGTGGARCRIPRAPRASDDVRVDFLQHLTGDGRDLPFSQEQEPQEERSSSMPRLDQQIIDHVKGPDNPSRLRLPIPRQRKPVSGQLIGVHDEEFAVVLLPVGQDLGAGTCRRSGTKRRHCVCWP